MRPYHSDACDIIAICMLIMPMPMLRWCRAAHLCAPRSDMPLMPSLCFCACHIFALTLLFSPHYWYLFADVAVMLISRCLFCLRSCCYFMIWFVRWCWCLLIIIVIIDMLPSWYRYLFWCLFFLLRDATMPRYAELIFLIFHCFICAVWCCYWAVLRACRFYARCHLIMLDVFDDIVYYGYYACYFALPMLPRFLPVVCCCRDIFTFFIFDCSLDIVCWCCRYLPFPRHAQLLIFFCQLLAADLRDIACWRFSALLSFRCRCSLLITFMLTPRAIISLFFRFISPHFRRLYFDAVCRRLCFDAHLFCACLCDILRVYVDIYAHIFRLFAASALRRYAFMMPFIFHYRWCCYYLSPEIIDARRCFTDFPCFATFFTPPFMICFFFPADVLIRRRCSIIFIICLRGARGAYARAMLCADMARAPALFLKRRLWAAPMQSIYRFRAILLIAIVFHYYLLLRYTIIFHARRAHDAIDYIIERYFTLALTIRYVMPAFDYAMPLIPSTAVTWYWRVITLYACRHRKTRYFSCYYACCRAICHRHYRRVHSAMPLFIIFLRYERAMPPRWYCVTLSIFWCSDDAYCFTIVAVYIFAAHFDVAAFFLLRPDAYAILISLPVTMLIFHIRCCLHFAYGDARYFSLMAMPYAHHAPLALRHCYTRCLIFRAMLLYALFFIEHYVCLWWCLMPYYCCCLFAIIYDATYDAMSPLFFTFAAVVACCRYYKPRVLSLSVDCRCHIIDFTFAAAHLRSLRRFSYYECHRVCFHIIIMRCYILRQQERAAPWLLLFFVLCLLMPYYSSAYDYIWLCHACDIATMFLLILFFSLPPAAIHIFAVLIFSPLSLAITLW